MRFDFMGPICAEAQRLPEGSTERQRMMVAIGTARCLAEHMVVECPRDERDAVMRPGDQLFDDDGNEVVMMGVSGGSRAVVGSGDGLACVPAATLHSQKPERHGISEVLEELADVMGRISALVCAMSLDDGVCYSDPEWLYAKTNEIARMTESLEESASRLEGEATDG